MTYVELKELSQKHPIILYDGFCLLCDRTIKYLIQQDTDQILRYHTLMETGEDNSSVKLLNKGELFEQSRVLIEVAKILDRPTWVLRILRYFPSIIRDFGYRVVAANRYRLFGKSDTCILPDADNKHLFLHL